MGVIVTLEDKATMIQNALNFLRDSLRQDPECFAYWSALANYNQDVLEAILKSSPLEYNFDDFKYTLKRSEPTIEELDGDCLNDESLYSKGD